MPVRQASLGCRARAPLRLASRARCIPSSLLCQGAPGRNAPAHFAQRTPQDRDDLEARLLAGCQANPTDGGREAAGGPRGIFSTGGSKREPFGLRVGRAACQWPRRAKDSVPNDRSGMLAAAFRVELRAAAAPVCAVADSACGASGCPIARFPGRNAQNRIPDMYKMYTTSGRACRSQEQRCRKIQEGAARQIFLAGLLLDISRALSKMCSCVMRRASWNRDDWICDFQIRDIRICVFRICGARGDETRNGTIRKG